jgi:two-component system sensor histidine kinase BarA
MTSEIFDMQLALKRAANKAELVRELMTLLLEDLPQQKSILEQRWQQADPLVLREIVHKIHGGTRYCGVPGLQNASEQLEIAIDAGQNDLQALYDALLLQIDRLMESDLEQLLQGH